MNLLYVNASRAAPGPRLGRAAIMLGVAAACMVLADCKPGAPKGQVVAVVNGQEVTVQDLAAEARATSTQPQAPQPVLQRVVARVLLAQSAHARHLDSYPGYPSDLARVQQDFLAEKALKATVKGPSKPSAQAISSFIATHPNLFKDRARLQADEIKFQSLDDMKSLNGADTLAAVASRLQSLNIPFTREMRTIDTAELPPALVDKISTLPPDRIFFIRNQDVVLGVVIKGREPVVMTPDQQAAEAAQIMSRISTQGQIDAELKELKSQAKISYQPGYAPPAKPNPGPAAPAKDAATQG